MHKNGCNLNTIKSGSVSLRIKLIVKCRVGNYDANLLANVVDETATSEQDGEEVKTRNIILNNM